jgi:hypothetical protein
VRTRYAVAGSHTASAAVSAQENRACTSDSSRIVSGGLKLLSEGRAKPVWLLFSVFFLKI